MDWKTKISDSNPNGAVIRGYDLEELMQHKSFTETIFLLLQGHLPNEQQTKMLNAIFVSSIDHGIAVASITSARTALSGGSPLQAGVAAGILSIGDFHGGAIEGAAKMLQQNKDTPAAQIVKQFVEQKKRIPGYGHKIYKSADPRAQKLLQIAEELGIAAEYCDKAQDIQNELLAQTEKQLPLNVDGAIAAIISDMQFDWRVGKGLFIIARTPGIVAHLHEEMDEKPVRRLDNYEYAGEKGKKLP